MIELNQVRMFKCPVCKRLHPVAADTPLTEVTCTDNYNSEVREIRARPDESLLTKNEWNLNRFDTKTKDYTNNLQLVGVRYHDSHPRNVKNW